MRKITVVTTSRADYSHLRWVLESIREHPELDLRFCAVGSMLSGEFGEGAREAESDGFPVDDPIECLISSDTDVGMAKTIGVASLGLADALARHRPDILLLIADRYELLAPAAVATALRIPIAHIEGGEVSEGAIDDAVRNAVTKLSHIHFTPTEGAALRVLAMGEEPWRVYRTGAPSLDHLRRSELPDAESLARELGWKPERPPVVVAYHPVTIAQDTLREADAVYEALSRIDQPLLFCFPNADAGSRQLVRRAEALCANREDARLFVNLNPVVYWAALRDAAAMVGNSSSGIMESPSLELPAVNIGMRQQGRERAGNIIDCAPEVEAILDAVRRALDPGFRRGLKGLVNPYGDGRSGERIARVLAEAPLGESLLLKRALPLEAPGAGEDGADEAG
ncbi:UDP-N-acetylglucosamine 2-epimerase [Moorena bouillonii]|uniref:UDP-N-acetylglucosamine 2-epimerase n=1 Tax=Moorena bouillonii TaxID=207920 RepID=UPI0013011F86|nr:UDP-N-acetylglucosamine 2-epimerase [Moorena bouillonii]